MLGQVERDEPGLVHLVETAYTEQLHCEIVLLELQSGPLKSLKLVSLDVRKGLSNASCPTVGHRSTQ